DARALQVLARRPDVAARRPVVDPDDLPLAVLARDRSPPALLDRPLGAALPRPGGHLDRARALHAPGLRVHLGVARHLDALVGALLAVRVLLALLGAADGHAAAGGAVLHAAAHLDRGLALAVGRLAADRAS